MRRGWAGGRLARGAATTPTTGPGDAVDLPRRRRRPAGGGGGGGVSRRGRLLLALLVAAAAAASWALLLLSNGGIAGVRIVGDGRPDPPSSEATTSTRLDDDDDDDAAAVAPSAIGGASLSSPPARNGGGTAKEGAASSAVRRGQRRGRRRGRRGARRAAVFVVEEEEDGNGVGGGANDGASDGDGPAAAPRVLPRRVRFASAAAFATLPPDDAVTGGGVAARDGRLLPRSDVYDDNDVATGPSLLVVRNETAHPPPIISPGCDASPLLRARPTCNDVHSLDLPGDILDDVARKVGKGGSRVVWAMLETHLPSRTKSGRLLTLPERWKRRTTASFVLKTLRWTREFEPPVYGKNGREAAALELSSFSEGVTDIYAFCGATTANAYMGGGDLAGFVKRYPAFAEEEDEEVAASTAADDDDDDEDAVVVGGNSTSGRGRLVPAHPGKTLIVALRLARAVADLHRDDDDADGDSDGGGGSTRDGGGGGGADPAAPALTIVHRDLDAANVLLSSDKPPRIYLDDFNHGYILRKTSAEDGGKTPCSYRDRYVCGEDNRRVNNRAPEECIPSCPLTRSVDTYGLGSVYFYLLSSGRHRPYGLNAGASDRPNPRDHPDWYRGLVLDEAAPPALPPEVERSDDGAVRAVREAMRDLMSREPGDRPSAGEVVGRLEEVVDKYVRKNAKKRKRRKKKA